MIFVLGMISAVIARSTVTVAIERLRPRCRAVTTARLYGWQPRGTPAGAAARAGGRVTMQMYPHLNFKGDCEAVSTFYERCLDVLGGAFRRGGRPLRDTVARQLLDAPLIADGLLL